MRQHLRRVAADGTAAEVGQEQLGKAGCPGNDPGRVRHVRVPGDRALFLRKEHVRDHPGGKVPGWRDNFEAVGDLSGLDLWRCHGMASGNEVGMDHEDAATTSRTTASTTIHPVSPTLRFLTLPALQGGGDKLRAEIEKAIVGRVEPISTDLAKEIGFDIYADEFWQKGMEQAKEFIDQLEKTL